MEDSSSKMLQIQRKKDTARNQKNKVRTKNLKQFPTHKNWQLNSLPWYESTWLTWEELPDHMYAALKQTQAESVRLALHSPLN